MRVWIMFVAYFVEEVDLVFAREEGGSDTMYRGISPSLIIKPALRVQVVEVRLIDKTERRTELLCHNTHVYFANCLLHLRDL